MSAPVLSEPVVVVDAGCRGGFLDGWRTLGPAARLFGFDPDRTECEALRARDPGAQHVRFVPAALGRVTGRAPLFVTRDPACTSLYPPEPRVVSTHPRLAVAMQVGETETDVLRLDEWAAGAGIDRVDVLALDTQGSELDVLEGAGALLDTVRVVDTEVEFNPIYAGQPLFGDVDAFLRTRGFVLWRLRHLVHYGRPENPVAIVDDAQFFDDEGVAFAPGGGQLFWGMATFVRATLADPEQSRDAAALTRDACALSVLGFADLASRTFARARALAEGDTLATIDSLVERLTRVGRSGSS